MCLLFPLFKYETSYPCFVHHRMAELEEVFLPVALPVLPSEKGFPVEEDVPLAVTEEIRLSGNVLLYIYLSGGIVVLLFFCVSVSSMLKVIRESRKIRREGYILCLLHRNISPFSWGRYIVLSETDYRNYPDEILIHEQTHVKKRHTVDLLFMEILLLLNWFNPVVWLLKRELREIHEYEADMSVLNKGINATKYQLLLVKKAIDGRYTLANSFNHSKIKNRVMMMLKERSNCWARLKPLLLLPLAAGVLYAFARPEVNRPLESLTKSESVSILPLTGQDGVKSVQAERKADLEIMVNSVGEILLSARIQGKQQPTVICTIDEFTEKVKPFFSKMAGKGNSSTLSVSLLVDGLASVDEIVKIKKLLTEVNNRMIVNTSIEENVFKLTSKQDCYPVVLKLQSAGGSREIECNDAASVAELELTDTEKVTIVASKKCKMDFIFDLRNMLIKKHPELSINYASI